MPDRDPMAPGEIARGFDDIKQRIKDLDHKIDRGVLGRAEFDADQRTVDRRFVAIEEDVEEIKDAVGSIAEREDDRRSLRTQTFIGPIVSGVVVGVGVAVLLVVIGL